MLLADSVTFHWMLLTVCVAQNMVCVGIERTCPVARMCVCWEMSLCLSVGSGTVMRP